MEVKKTGWDRNAYGAHGRCEQVVGRCIDPAKPYTYGHPYVGHDGPSLLFYSSTPGSENSGVYLIRLPKDPPTLPNQAGTGGTFNFQLHPAFWVGMAICDTQSFPEYTQNCTPDSDSNIFDDVNPNSEHYLGHHPGAAFMEMQFYPPGWVPWPEGVAVTLPAGALQLTLTASVLMELPTSRQIPWNPLWRPIHQIRQGSLLELRRSAAGDRARYFATRNFPRDFAGGLNLRHSFEHRENFIQPLRWVQQPSLA